MDIQVPAIDLIKIPDGDFWLGSPYEQPNAHPNETPQSRYYLPTYFISRYPITNAEYAIFVHDKKYLPPEHWGNKKPPEELLNHPVVNVDFNDAQEYCRWLSHRSNQFYRLPTEFEWEKAARGPEDDRIFPWGNEWVSYRCNSKEDGFLSSTAVNDYEDRQKNFYNIVDMIGNVWEWTSSRYEAYEGSEYRSLQYSRNFYVVRGGSFMVDKFACRISNRGRYERKTKRPYLGFRIASNAISFANTPFENSKVNKLDQELNRRELRRKMYEQFSLEEIWSFIFDLEFKPDDFTGKLRKIIPELIEECERKNKLSKLLTIVQKERPNGQWEEVYRS